MISAFLSTTEQFEVQKRILSEAVAKQLEESPEDELLPEDVLLKYGKDCLRIMDHFPQRLEPESPEQVIHFGLVADGDLSFEEYRKVEDRLVSAVLTAWHLSNERCIVKTSLIHARPQPLRRAMQYLSQADVHRLNQLTVTLRERPDDSFVTENLSDLELLIRIGLREAAPFSVVFEPLSLGLISQFDMQLLVWVKDMRAQDVLEAITQKNGLYWRHLPKD